MDRDAAYETLQHLVGAHLTVEYLIRESCEQNHPEAVFHPEGHIVTVEKEVKIIAADLS